MASRRLPEMSRCINFMPWRWKQNASSETQVILSYFMISHLRRQYSSYVCNLIILPENLVERGHFKNAQRQKRVVSLMLRPLYPLEKGPLYPFNRRQDENSRASVVTSNNRNICASSLVATLTTLSPLQKMKREFKTFLKIRNDI